MRILFVHRNARLSGLTTYVRSLLPALRARGHQCELVVRPGTGSAGLAAALGKRPWWHPPPAGWAARKIEKIIRCEGIELVNAQTRRCAVHALPACRRTGTPLVMTLHSITDLSGCKEAVEYARALVVMNENARHYYADRYPGLADKLRLTRLPVELSRFRPAALNGGTARILYLGRLSRSKGEAALDLVEATRLMLPRVPDLELTIAGTGSRLKPARRRAAEVNRQAQRQVIEVVGKTAFPEQLIAAAGIVVGAGYAALEGLACGRKVVGLGVWGLLGVITPDNMDAAIASNFGDSGAVWEEITPALLAEQIWQAYQQEEADPQWARKILEAQFAPERVAESLEAVFAEALRSR